MAPGATHVPGGVRVLLLQHAPSTQTLPQHGWPGAPHTTHAPSEQCWPAPEHAASAITQVFVPGSQQPPRHGVAPAQQACPVWPHGGAAPVQL